MRTNLTSLERLEAHIRTLKEGTPQGAAWEAALVRWVNAGGHPDLVKGWGWKQWPGRTKAGLPRIERGVDLIAEDRAGRLVAIQAKFRNDPDSPVKTGEVQKFVGAYRKHFPRRMLISNASSRARGIKEAVGDAEAELVLRTELMDSLFDWVAAKPLPKPKVTPLPFQKDAAAAIKKHLKDGGRAQIVMACGSGKTYTTLLAMEALGSKRVLVLAPTLLLVKQLRDEWMRERTNAWATLAVCSDIGTDEGDDSTQLSPGEIGAKPTTDPVEIAQFLKSKGPFVVFGTYASSARIATAQKKAGVPAFDLVVADEAHRIAGAVGKADKEERAQRVVLDENGIRAERRLFATATPRVYGGDKKRDGEEIVLESMDDPARFGEEVYKLTFQQAVDLERLVPYKLLVTIVTDEEIAALIHDRKYVDLQGKPIPADDLATAIAVRRAYKELGISRVISYHGNIKRARAFAQLVQEVKTSGKAPEAECVTGAMPVEDRKEALTRLAQADGPYLITNARCLTEGIDVPALDAVAFADPRRSQVDIVQAVGRAMRKPRGKSTKTTGYIILPVFLSKKELKDPETAVEGSAFAPVLQVLRALKAHDPYRATFFAKILVEEGKRPHKKGEGINEVLEVSIGKELDRALAKRLELAVQLRAVNVAADNFHLFFEHLKKYKSQFGNANALNSYKVGTYPLGRKLEYYRRMYRGRNLPKDQTDLLNTLQVSWDPLEESWSDFVLALEAFKAKHGHLRIAQKDQINGIRIGRWTNKYRSRYKRGAVSPDRELALRSIGFIWNQIDERWNRAYEALQEYQAKTGDTNPPRGTIVHGIDLANWCKVQRRTNDRGTITEEKKKQLNLLNFLWRPTNSSWDEGVASLRHFRTREGHADVPTNHIENTFTLGQWVMSRRQDYRKGKLTTKEISQLESQGMIWDIYEHRWNLGFNALRSYVKRTGSTVIPRGWVEEEVPLYSWLSNQKMNFRKGNLSVEKIHKLESLGVQWTLRSQRSSESFEEGFRAYQVFVEQNDHALVPRQYMINGYPLGAWTQRCRDRRDRLSPEQVRRLNQLGFIWTAAGVSWNRGLLELTQYVKSNGSALVPQKYVVGGFRLGSWVSSVRQRRKRKSLSKAQILQLDSIGFVWS